MRLPGFTAEVSLSPARTNYKAASAHMSRVVEGIVSPQIFCHGNWCCDEWGNCIYKGKLLQ
jgi:hypothetical protein